MGRSDVSDVGRNTPEIVVPGAKGYNLKNFIINHFFKF